MSTRENAHERQLVMRKGVEQTTEASPSGRLSYLKVPATCINCVARPTDACDHTSTNLGSEPQVSYCQYYLAKAVPPFTLLITGEAG